MKRRILHKLLIFTVIIMFSNLGSSCRVMIPKDNDNSITIPLDISTQRPVLELTISGKGSYQFIFDTGSSGSVIDEELAKELGLEVIGEDSLRTPGSDNTLISKRIKVPKVAFPDIKISEDAIMNTIALREMLSVDGILSPVFFSNYLLTLDYPNSKLILTSGELSTQDKDVIPFLPEIRVINFDVFVDGNELEAHLDSGNPGGFDIPFSLKDKLHFKDKPSEAGVISTPVASFKRWEATLMGDIKIGSVTYKNPDVNLIEGFQFVNLGYQIFKDLKITIDKKKNLIKFEKSTSAVDEKEEEEYQGEKNDYTGWYGGHARKIFIENGEMYLRRDNHPKLKLVKIKDDEYKMVFKIPVMNELPNVKFKRDETNEVTGLTFVFKDGREEFVKKDK